MAVELCDRHTWQELARETEPNFYGRPEWLEIGCAALGLEPRYLVVVVRSVPVVRVALVARRRLGSTYLLTTPLAPYTGWAEAFPDDLEPARRQLRRGEALEELALWCEAHASYGRIVLPPEVEDVRPFIWRGWRTELRYTYRIPLQRGGQLPLRTNARRNLERAQSAELTVRHPTGPEAVDALDATMRATFSRQREPIPIPEKRWRSYLEQVAALPSVRIVSVTGAGTPLATALIGFDSRRSYELHAGTTVEGAANGASVLALWTAIQESADRVSEFDFAGANIPTVAHFKRGFGGRLVPYVAVAWARSSLARWRAERGPALKARLRRMVGT